MSEGYKLGNMRRRNWAPILKAIVLFLIVLNSLLFAYNMGYEQHRKDATPKPVVFYPECPEIGEPYVGAFVTWEGLQSSGLRYE